MSNGTISAMDENLPFASVTALPRPLGNNHSKSDCRSGSVKVVKIVQACVALLGALIWYLIGLGQERREAQILNLCL